MSSQPLQMALVRNTDGPSTLWWPSNTSTTDIIKMAVRSWDSGILNCDCATATVFGVIVWGPDSWWMIIACWAVYFAQHGDRDATSGLRLDFSGERMNVLTSTLLAYREHGRHYFDGQELDMRDFTVHHFLKTNATVQAWGVNELINSHRISTIVQIIHASRPINKLGARLAKVGILSGWPELFEAIQNHTQILSEETISALRTNGKMAYERRCAC